MCEDRQYTPAAVAELQTIALAVELRRRIRSRQSTRATLIYLSEISDWLDELAPAPNYSQCDNPPEAVTLADYTAGMVE